MYGRDLVAWLDYMFRFVEMTPKQRAAELRLPR
jgi:hypothetical protein